MEELLKELVGKNIDVSCGTAAVYRGEAIAVKDGVLQLRNEEDTDVFISIEKIAAVHERRDLPSRPGFIV